MDSSNLTSNDVLQEKLLLNQPIIIIVKKIDATFNVSLITVYFQPNLSIASCANLMSVCTFFLL